MLFNKYKLMNDVCDHCGFREGSCILGKKWHRHVQAVQPHLVGVDQFVPIAAAGCARLALELGAQLMESCQVARVSGALLPGEKHFSRIDLVEIAVVLPLG